MLNLRQRIFVVIGIIAGLIAAIIFGYIYTHRTSADNTEAVVETPTAGGNQESQNTQAPSLQTGGAEQPSVGTTPVVTAQPEKPSATPDEVYLRQTARIFVERFGSHSPETGTQYLEDLLSISSPTVQTWLRSLMNEPHPENSTTKVVASSITSNAGGKASVHVDTQQYMDENGKITTSYKSGRVELVKDGMVWKVDGFYWDT